MGEFLYRMNISVTFEPALDTVSLSSLFRKGHSTYFLLIDFFKQILIGNINKLLLIMLLCFFFFFILKNPKEQIPVFSLTPHDCSRGKRGGFLKQLCMTMLAVLPSLPEYRPKLQLRLLKFNSKAE